VFVRADIVLVEEAEETYTVSADSDAYADSVSGAHEEEYSGVSGMYRDEVSWEWLRSFEKNAPDGRTNDSRYRTPDINIKKEELPV
jgi:hypothetical protein